MYHIYVYVFLKWNKYLFLDVKTHKNLQIIKTWLLLPVIILYSQEDGLKVFPQKREDFEMGIENLWIMKCPL